MGGTSKFCRYFVNLSEVALYVEIVLLHLLAISIGVDDDQGGRPDGSVSLIRERDFSTILYYKEKGGRKRSQFSVFALFQIRQKFRAEPMILKKYESLSPLSSPL